MKDKIFIVGGGNSLKDFDFNLLKNEITICINQSIFHVPEPNYFITMDYSWILSLKTKGQYEDFIMSNVNKFFIANLSPNSGLRYIDNQFIFKNKDVYDLSSIDVIIKSSFSKIFGNWNSFAHGNNSGFCALQLALCLRFKEIYLLGVDLCTKDGKSHYHDDYKQDIKHFHNKLELYYENFKSSINDYKENKPKTKIISCSKISRLNEFIIYKNINEVVR